MDKRKTIQVNISRGTATGRYHVDRLKLAELGQPERMTSDEFPGVQEAVEKAGYTLVIHEE